MRRIFLVLLLIWPLGAAAAPSDALIQQIKAAPDRFMEDVAGLILGYGVDGMLDSEGVARYVAVERARLRVREERRLMLADLDGDGVVTQGELAVLMQAEGAGPRGRLAVAHLRADADGDGRVTEAERGAEARRVANVAVAGTQARTLDVLTLDLDGDKRIDLAEVRRAMALVLPGA